LKSRVDCRYSDYWRLGPVPHLR